MQAADGPGIQTGSMALGGTSLNNPLEKNTLRSFCIPKMCLWHKVRIP